MCRMRLKFLLTVLLALCCAKAQYVGAQSPQAIQFRTGTDALQVCQSENELFRITCYSWIRGFLDGAAATTPTDYWIPNYCAPDGVTIEESKRLFVRYLRSNPDDLGHTASYLFRRALREKFPCPSS